jgi:sugar phosphate permease
VWLLVLFGLAGVFVAWEDTIEGVAVRDYVADPVAGTAYGLMGAVNGIGDLVSSLVVGLIWTTLGVGWGFGYAALAGLVGAVCMALVRPTARM